MAAAEFKGVATLVVHEHTPYRLLTELMYTAGQADFPNFKFAVIKKLVTRISGSRRNPPAAVRRLCGGFRR